MTKKTESEMILVSFLWDAKHNSYKQQLKYNSHTMQSGIYIVIE